MCRGRTSHLKLVKRELRTMRPNTTDQETHKQTNKKHKPTNQNPKTKARFVTRVGYVSLSRKVRHGAMNLVRKSQSQYMFYLRVSIVSAGTRQKFAIPLGFHGFAAPQALVLHTLRTCMSTHVLELGRPSAARPVFARVFGPQTGVQKNHFFRSLEGAKSLENL